jgi:hypothetical protein
MPPKTRVSLKEPWSETEGGPVSALAYCVRACGSGYAPQTRVSLKEPWSETEGDHVAACAHCAWACGSGYAPQGVRTECPPMVVMA